MPIDAPGESPLGVERAGLPADCEVDGRVLVGADVAVGAGVRIDGPAVIGDGATIEDGARIRVHSSSPAPGPRRRLPRRRDRGPGGLASLDSVGWMSLASSSFGGPSALVGPCALAILRERLAAAGLDPDSVVIT